jgi:hypothetical protein
MPYRQQPKIKRKPFANKPTYRTGLITPAAWRKLRIQVIQTYPVCNECGRMPSTVADHITPVRLGGDFWDLITCKAFARAVIIAKVQKKGKRYKTSESALKRLKMRHLTRYRVHNLPGPTL